MNELEALYRRATAEARRPGIDTETRKTIQRHWQAIHSGIDATNPDAFNEHLGQELDRLYRETAPDERREKLCGEGNLRCNVLRGKIPVELQRTGSRFDPEPAPIRPSDARQYLAKHSKCHAIRTALETWGQEYQQTKQHLQAIIALATTGKAEPDVLIDESNIPGV